MYPLSQRERCLIQGHARQFASSSVTVPIISVR